MAGLTLLVLVRRPIGIQAEEAAVTHVTHLAEAPFDTPAILEALRAILTTAQTVAVVGLSDNPDKPSYAVPAYLQSQGYRIIPVNPKLTEALGEKAYASLDAIPEPVDVVQIFRRAEDVPPIAEAAIAKGARVVWMQPGIISPPAAARAEAAGLTVVMEACMRATHQLLRAQGQI